jgi:hypothetical protein
MSRAIVPSALVAATLATFALAQSPPANYDEGRVPAYTLPDALVARDGSRVASPGQWPARRAEILGLFADHVYGRTPKQRVPVRVGVREKDAVALAGKARRTQVTLHFGPKAGGPFLDLLTYRPAAAPGRAPAFLGLNFGGNHTVSADPGIALARCWIEGGPGVAGHAATEAARGAASGRWPIEAIVARGYAVATACYGDIDPDFDDGFANGVHPLFRAPGAVAKRAPTDWGSIGAWAWGLSRALDQLETMDGVDGGRVAVIGHSRLGKTALWAAAQDERFWLAVSNDSGEGGAALARRRFGETVKDLNMRFPHWFAEAYRRYDDDVAALPVDQHMLLALIAPRPLYVASATEDLWADPKGEFLSAKAAEPVYRLLGAEGLGADAPPPPDTPIGRTIAYHNRKGKHDVTAWDWERYLDFADRHRERADR